MSTTHDPVPRPGPGPRFARTRAPMTGFANLAAVTLLAAAPGGPVVPLVGDPASPPPAAAAPRVLVCLPKASVALEPQVERAFSCASLVTISPDHVARRFPP